MKMESLLCSKSSLSRHKKV